MNEPATLPFSPACENNKRPILERLTSWLEQGTRILEVGAGTGQHAAWFHQHRPDLHWQCVDQPHQLPGLRARLQQEASGLPAARAFTLGCDGWPDASAEVLYTANTLHILPVEFGDQLCAMAEQNLPKHGQVIIYGPFKLNGKHTAESNRTFDEKLKAQGHGGVRDLEEVCQALGPGWRLAQRATMPANNQMLQFVRARIAPM